MNRLRNLLITATILSFLSAPAMGDQYATDDEGPATPKPTKAAPLTAESLSGTWNVTIKPAGAGTCDRGKPKLKVYQWLVSVNRKKVEVEVSVQPKQTSRSFALFALFALQIRNLFLRLITS